MLGAKIIGVSILLIHLMPGLPSSLVMSSSLIQPIIEGPRGQCLKYSTPIKKRWALSQNLKLLNSTLVSISNNSYFEPIQFRANNYGTSRYKLYFDEKIDSPSKFLVSIEMLPGPKQDTMKGGELNGFYAFQRTVVNFQIEGDRPVLDIWNLYYRKNDSANSKSAHSVIALKVTFQENENPNPNFDPIITALKKLTKNITSVNLPHNYDPYSILPLETGFAIYETNDFPFFYPMELESSMDDSNSSECGPIIKVYLLTHPITISKPQLDQVQTVAEVLGGLKSLYNSSSFNDNEMYQNDLSLDLGKVFYTPMEKHLLFRRMVAEAHSMEGQDLPDEDDEENDDEEQEEPEEEEVIDENDPAELAIHQKPIIPKDEEPFPEDCTILYKVVSLLEERQNTITTKAESHPEKSNIYVLVTTLLFAYGIL